MTEINAVTRYDLEGDVGVITLNSPPVNALSAGVRDGLAGGMAAALADAGAKAIVIICEGRTFIAGADITEFGGAAEGREPVRRAGRHRGLAEAGDRRDPRHGAGRRPGGGAGLPLPRRRALGALRPAGGEPRPVARRRRHPAAAANRRRREGAGDDDLGEPRAGERMPGDGPGRRDRPGRRAAEGRRRLRQQGRRRGRPAEEGARDRTRRWRPPAAIPRSSRASARPTRGGSAASSPPSTTSAASRRP